MSKLFFVARTDNGSQGNSAQIVEKCTGWQREPCEGSCANGEDEHGRRGRKNDLSIEQGSHSADRLLTQPGGDVWARLIAGPLFV